MGKSTQPLYWGRSVITGHTVVGDMLEWALKGHLKAAKTLLIVIGIFMSCWQPFCFTVFYIGLTFTGNANSIMSARIGVYTMSLMQSAFLLAGRLAGWGKDGEINTASILGLFCDNRTHCGRGYA